MVRLAARLVRYTLAIACCLSIESRLLGQCPEWNPAFRLGGTVELPGTGAIGSVRSLHVYDDGHGAALYASPGLASPATLARWAGDHWEPVTGLTGGIALCMAEFDDGSGPALFAGGALVPPPQSVGLVRWDGTTATFPGGGVNGTVHALAVFDDGSGPALYAGGLFTQAGGVTTNDIARWDGQTWSAVGTGVGGASSLINALAVYDDGSGPALYAAGQFSSIGGVTVSNIGKWNGSTWSAVGAGPALLGAVEALEVFDNGTGPKLYVGGFFTNVPNLIRWDGTAWQVFGVGPNSTVRALAAVNLGGAPVLVVGGSFSTVGGPPMGGIARFNGTSWSAMGAGFTEPAVPVGGVWSLAMFDSGHGPELLAGGEIWGSGSVAVRSLARWTGTSWKGFDSGPLTGGADKEVRALAAFDDGTGMALWAGGHFYSVGDAYSPRIARYDGTRWNPMPWFSSGILSDKDVTALHAADLGSGPHMYAGAQTLVARWDGSYWTSLGATLDSVEALLEYNDSGTTYLFAGGKFSGIGSVPANGIARWNGSSWSTLGIGMNGPVLALATFDDGGGLALFAGGTFTTAGGLPANYIARWRSGSWSAVGAGLNNHVYSLAVYDDGSGPALFAGGGFTSAGGVPANRLAKWNGVSWQPLGSGLDGIPMSLAVHDDGNGPALYAAGVFASAGGVAANSIARWDGANWSALGLGLGPDAWGNWPWAEELLSFDDGAGAGAHLYVGGDFGGAGGYSSSKIAEWGVCPEPGLAMCFGDGSIQPCPCSNPGLTGNGCENSAGTGGAHLAALGTTRPDRVQLRATGEPPNSVSLVLQSRNVIVNGVAFGDGLLCAGGALRRMYVKRSTGGTVVAPSMDEVPIQARSAALGDPILPGERRYYQVCYRDGVPAFCPAPLGSSFNLSNAVKIVW